MVIKKSRHPTKKKVRKPTHSVPSISLPIKDLELLQHLNKTNTRLNVRQYSISKKIPRSTIYDIRNRLDRKGLINVKLAEIYINEMGRILLKTINKDVGSSRSECRKDELSIHIHTFILPISNRENFRILRLNKLKHQGYKENKLNNLHQIIVTFEDAKIIINPKQVRINLKDIVGTDSEAMDAECLSRAIEYAELLKSVGIETEGLMVETGHWAKVESVLSDFLFKKVDNKYFLELSDGSKFWIDHSPDKDGNPKREHETNDKIVAANINNALDKIGIGEVDLDDVNVLKQSLGLITKMESLRLQDHIEENKLKRLQLERPKEIKLESTYKGYLG